MKKIFLLVLFVGFITSGFCALPPFYQSTKEIKALITDPRFHEKLGSGQYIQSITRKDHGWLIKTPKYLLFVDVKYSYSHRIGPAEFEFIYNDPEEIE